MICKENNDHLRKALLAILIRDGKKAAYWMTHVTIRMTDEVGDLLYEILKKENGGWVQGKNTISLKGCSCMMAKVKEGGFAPYRVFQPCPSHVCEIVELLEQAMINTVRPSVKLPKMKKDEIVQLPKMKKHEIVQLPKMKKHEIVESPWRAGGFVGRSLIKVRKPQKPVSKYCTTGSNSDIPRNIYEQPSGLMPGVRSKG